MSKINCPYCSYAFGSNPDLSGKLVRCGRCKKPFQIPLFQAKIDPESETDALPPQIKWVALTGVGLVLLAVGLGIGYLLTYSRTKSHNQTETALLKAENEKTLEQLKSTNEKEQARLLSALDTTKEKLSEREKVLTQTEKLFNEFKRNNELTQENLKLEVDKTKAVQTKLDDLVQKLKVKQQELEALKEGDILFRERNLTEEQGADLTLMQGAWVIGEPKGLNSKVLIVIWGDWLTAFFQEADKLSIFGLFIIELDPKKDPKTLRLVKILDKKEGLAEKVKREQYDFVYRIEEGKFQATLVSFRSYAVDSQRS